MAHLIPFSDKSIFFLRIKYPIEKLLFILLTRISKQAIQLNKLTGNEFLFENFKLLII